MTVLTEMERKVLDDIANERDPRVELGDILNSRFSGKILVSDVEPKFPTKTALYYTFPAIVYTGTTMEFKNSEFQTSVVYEFLGSAEQIPSVPTNRVVDIRSGGGATIDGQSAMTAFSLAFNSYTDNHDILIGPDDRPEPFNSGALGMKFSSSKAPTPSISMELLVRYVDSEGVPYYGASLFTTGEVGMIVDSGTLVQYLTDLYLYRELVLQAGPESLTIPMWIKFQGTVTQVPTEYAPFFG